MPDPSPPAPLAVATSIWTTLGTTLFATACTEPAGAFAAGVAVLFLGASRELVTAAPLPFRFGCQGAHDAADAAAHESERHSAHHDGGAGGTLGRGRRRLPPRPVRGPEGRGTGPEAPHAARPRAGHPGVPERRAEAARTAVWAGAAHRTDCPGGTRRRRPADPSDLPRGAAEWPETARSGGDLASPAGGQADRGARPGRHRHCRGCCRRDCFDLRSSHHFHLLRPPAKGGRTVSVYESARWD